MAMTIGPLVFEKYGMKVFDSGRAPAPVMMKKYAPNPPFPRPPGSIRYKEEGRKQEGSKKKEKGGRRKTEGRRKEEGRQRQNARRKKEGATRFTRKKKVYIHAQPFVCVQPATNVPKPERRKSIYLYAHSDGPATAPIRNHGF